MHTTTSTSIRVRAYSLKALTARTVVPNYATGSLNGELMGRTYLRTQGSSE